MALITLAFLALYLALAFGLRTWLLWRRTGTTGFRGVSGAVGSAEWFGGVLFVAALAAVIVAPLADLLGWLAPASALVRPSTHIAGISFVVAGSIGTLWSQLAMGDAWRIGVDEQERTELVVNGPFRWVRNPIFTSMVLAVSGLALLIPNPASASALIALIVALQLQVRKVEEPYLLRVHDTAYRRYAARTGRFLPGVGRLHPS